MEEKNETIFLRVRTCLSTGFNQRVQGILPGEDRVDLGPPGQPGLGVTTQDR